MIFKRPEIKQSDIQPLISKLVNLMVCTPFMCRGYNHKNGCMILVEPNERDIVCFGITSENKFRVVANVSSYDRHYNFFDMGCCASLKRTDKFVVFDMEINKIDYVMGYLSK